VNGEVIMYADHVTDSMAETLRETERRRTIQAAYNAEHGITPESIRSSIRELLQTIYERDYVTVEADAPAAETFESPADRERRIAELETQMKDAARRLDFEHAAELRDKIRSLRRQQVTAL
jgi:excinuclease ABC subunit B